ncbi:MAG: hypothetical protein M3033_09040 [Acidobacteriota bacterium]|nr:hypothetical protein [Acidobacteriota bacterium]
MAWDRNSAHYPRPVAQFDPTACWAAGLEWWLRCMRNSRAFTSQLDLINRFSEYWNHDEDSPEYGTITGVNFGHIMDHDSIRMSYVVRAAGSWDKDFIAGKLDISPVVIGYNEQEVNGFHVNVIHSLNNTASADVNVMDPNGGRYRTRSNQHFKSGNYVLGWAI